MAAEDTAVKEENGVNTGRLVKQFTDLVSIDSLSYQEREMADYLKKVWKTRGVELLEDDAAERIGGNAGNLYGKIPAVPDREGRTDVPVLLVGHMDTVAPGIGKKAVLHEDGTITSDGTTVLGADDAAALAIILEAVTELQEEGIPHREIQLLFPVAEEVYTVGSSAFDFSHITAKEGYALDCSDRIGAYSAQEPTLISFEITVTGRGAHAGFEPEKGINAIATVANAIARIRQGWADDHTTLNIGLISGGTATNAVPSEVTVKGELRSAVHEDALATYENTVKVFEEEAAKTGAAVRASKKIHLTAYRVEKDNPALVRYEKVLRAHGIEPYAKPNFGGSDNNVLMRNGIQGICTYNPMHGCHTTAEYTSVKELTAMTAIVKDLLKVAES